MSHIHHSFSTRPYKRAPSSFALHIPIRLALEFFVSLKITFKMSVLGFLVRRSSEHISSHIPDEGISTHRFYRIDASDALVLSQNRDVCEICHETFAAQQDLVRRGCCQLLAHISCLAAWANTVPLSQDPPPEGESSPPLSFTCPKCRTHGDRAWYLQAANAAVADIARSEAAEDERLGLGRDQRERRHVERHRV